MAILSSKISFHFFKRWGLGVWLRLFYNSKSSCLIFPNSGMTGLHHCAHLERVFVIDILCFSPLPSSLWVLL